MAQKSKPANWQSIPVSLKHNILIQEFGKELLLYDLDRNKAFCLNETSLLIWNLCDGNNTVEDIRYQVSRKLKVKVPEEVIWLALDGLKNEKLLKNHLDIEINFKGLNRRQIVKKIALTTLIAIPLISTIISPMAVAAQSAGVCQATTTCFCPDASCTQFGATALLQNSCTSAMCNGSNCRCVGPFLCGTNQGERFGRCGLV